MALISLAIDYKKTPIEVRSDFALSGENIAILYETLLAIENINNAVILSTCNRTEIYLDVSSLRTIDSVLAWWQSYISNDKHNICDYFKLRQGSEFIKHLMKLSCGLESMVLGESQILGQVKDAYTLSKENDALGKELDRIFQKVFSTAKRVRSQTRIGHCPVSVAFSAVSLAKDQLDNISTKNVMIIGAGKTGELLFRHIGALKPKNIMLLNRSIERAERIVESHKHAKAYSLDSLDEMLKHADIVICAVTVDEYVINADDVGLKPRVFIDLSIPMALDPKLADMEQNVYYCVDDINNAVETGKDKRKKETGKADKIIASSLEEFLEKEKSIISNTAIKELFDKTDIIVDAILERSITKINNGRDSEEVIRRFAYDIKKKVLHYPVKGMKQASKDGRSDFLDYMKVMFGLTKDKK